MPEPIQIAEIDIYKKPIYTLLDFLLRKRTSRAGMGLNTTISFPLGEFNALFEYMNGSDEEEKVNNVKTILKTLSDDSVIIDGIAQQIITILNPDILNSFLESYQNNESIKIRYTSENVEAYQSELRKRTEALKRRRGGISVETTSSGGALISVGAKVMETRPRDSAYPVGPHIILLLAGNIIPLSSGPISIQSYSQENDGFYDDYERGDSVEIDYLQRILSYIKDPGRIFVVEKRSITDSIRTINTKSSSEENFGADIFITEGNSVRWIL
jgi:hypothetical protein